MLRAIPPVPVAAFGDQDFFKGDLPLLFPRLGSGLGIEVARVVKIVPGAVVFRRTNPDVEVSVNPGARNQRLEPRKLLVALNGLGNRGGLDTILTLQGIIEPA